MVSHKREDNAHNPIVASTDLSYNVSQQEAQVPTGAIFSATIASILLWLLLAAIGYSTWPEKPIPQGSFPPPAAEEILVALVAAFEAVITIFLLVCGLCMRLEYGGAAIASATMMGIFLAVLYGLVLGEFGNSALWSFYIFGGSYVGVGVELYTGWLQRAEDGLRHVLQSEGAGSWRKRRV